MCYAITNDLYINKLITILSGIFGGFSCCVCFFVFSFLFLISLCPLFCVPKVASSLIVPSVSLTFIYALFRMRSLSRRSRQTVAQLSTNWWSHEYDHYMYALYTLYTYPLVNLKNVLKFNKNQCHELVVRFILDKRTMNNNHIKIILMLAIKIILSNHLSDDDNKKYNLLLPALYSSFLIIR